MSELEESFEKLLGRQPSDLDRQRLYQVKEALGLANNDALWLVLIALQHYESLYGEIPDRISEAAETTLGEFRDAAAASAAQSAEAVKAELTRSIAATARSVARDVAGKEKLQWLAGAAIICSLVLSTTGWGGYAMGQRQGERTGYVEGYEDAKDERAAASWAATPEGQAVYRFWKVGSIAYLAACSQPGWQREGDVCHPGPAPDGKMYGWRLP